MENENKDFGLEPQNLEPDTQNTESVEELSVETIAETSEEAVQEFTEDDFDPTLSDDFYNNLDAAISGEEQLEDTELPELLLGDALFETVENISEPNTLSEAEEDMFAGVDAALAEQIEHEFGKESAVSDAEPEEKKAGSVWKAIPTWTKVLVGFIIILLVSVGLLFGTKTGKKIVTKIVVGILFEDIPVEDEETPTPSPTFTITPEPTHTPTPEPTLEPAG